MFGSSLRKPDFPPVSTLNIALSAATSILNFWDNSVKSLSIIYFCILGSSFSDSKGIIGTGKGSVLRLENNDKNQLNILMNIRTLFCYIYKRDLKCQ